MIYIITDKIHSKLPINKKGYKIIMYGYERSPKGKNIIYLDDEECMKEMLPKRKAYSYLLGLYYLYKNVSIIPDDIFCIYQDDKAFNVKPTDIEQIFEDGYNAIVANPLTDFNIFKQYIECHNELDIIDCLNMIKNIYGDSVFNEFFKYISNNNNFFSEPVFAMKGKYFYALCDFIFKVLDKFNARHALFTDDDFSKFAESNMVFLKDNAAKYITYQMQLPKYLAERMASFYIILLFKPDEIYQADLIKVE